MKDKNNRIITEHGTVNKLAKTFRVSTAVVSMALNGKRESDLCRKIRHTAITQYGGREYAPVNTGENNNQ